MKKPSKKLLAMKEMLVKLEAKERKLCQLLRRQADAAKAAGFTLDREYEKLEKLYKRTIDLQTKPLATAYSKAEKIRYATWNKVVTLDEQVRQLIGHIHDEERK